MPKEIFSNKEFGEKYFDLFETELTDFFEIKHGKESIKNTYEFIRKLRNSVAHVNFAWDKNRSIIKLWNNYKGNKNFEVETDLEKLTNFAIKISEFMSKNQTQLKFLK